MYNRPKLPAAAVTLNASTYVPLFATPTPGRVGWRCNNPSDPAGANQTISIIVVPASPGQTPVPTDALGIDFTVSASKTVVDEASEYSMVYAKVSASTLDVFPRELM